MADGGSPRSRAHYADDPAKGFVYERVPYVSAAVLAYDEEREPTLLVDRPYKKKGVVRVSSPFTVESESPWRYLPADADRLGAQQHDSDLAVAVRAALETAGVQIPGAAERLRLDGLEPYAGGDGGGLVTHLADRAGDDGDDTAGRVAVAILPDDITVPATLITRAANEAVTIAGVDTLLVVAFAFEAGTGSGAERRGRLRVLRAQANRDLMIGNLKDTAQDVAFVLVGEPEVVIAPAPGPGNHYTCEVQGYEVFDPATGNLRSGRADEIACWMLDADHDGKAFFAHRLHFPGHGKDRQLRRLATALGSRLNRDAWNAMLSLKSTPFPKPESGEVAVRIITHTGAEMAVVLPVPPR